MSTQKFSDELIAVLREVITMSFATSLGSNLVDWFRTVETYEDQGVLYPTPAYQKMVQEQWEHVEKEGERLHKETELQRLSDESTSKLL